MFPGSLRLQGKARLVAGPVSLIGFSLRFSSGSFRQTDQIQNRGRYRLMSLMDGVCVFFASPSVKVPEGRVNGVNRLAVSRDDAYMFSMTYIPPVLRCLKYRASAVLMRVSKNFEM
ncbi:hypothetical protein DYI23_01530 [Roseibium polysiphoniae]|uniref:Uncharacterized protein n=1 Tax=Roseibium polysiphoniae TaxID=2571221 RepID=A0A944C6U3_9HYPH|nr:hypothetical protein [Roseibium polysiphoniae]